MGLFFFEVESHQQKSIGIDAHNFEEALKLFLSGDYEEHVIEINDDSYIGDGFDIAETGKRYDWNGNEIKYD